MANEQNSRISCGVITYQIEGYDTFEKFYIPTNSRIDLYFKILEEVHREYDLTLSQVYYSGQAIITDLSEIKTLEDIKDYLQRRLKATGHIKN